MIQTSQIKTTELPKARAKSSDSEVVTNQKHTAKTSKKNEVSVSQKEKKEINEFDKELENAVAVNEGGTQVKAIKMSQDPELPSSPVNPNGTVETISPKIFDSSITNDVEKLISPKSVDNRPVILTDQQVAQLAGEDANPKSINLELEQALLKTPQTVAAGAVVAPAVEGAPTTGPATTIDRAPAIDFAKAEIDPQILNNEDFLSQKNMITKKTGSNAYGMKALPQTQQEKIAIENGLKPSQVIKETSANDSAMNSQQFILGLQSEHQTSQLNVNEAQPTVKTFDMSNIKSSRPTEIMNQITDYVVQAKAAKEPTISMRVNHDELGIIDITVSRVGQVSTDTLAINIGAHSSEGKNFFTQNSKDLFSHLTSAGINVSDLKVETPSQTAKNDFDFGSQSGRNNSGSEKQFGSEQNQRRHEQDRRQDLWKLLSKEAA
jgi:hypothetical protein